MFELALSPFPELPEKPASHRRRANSAVLVSRDDSAPSLQKAITSLSIARRSSERESRRQSLSDENMRSILFAPMTLAHWLPETADIQRISGILETAHHNGAANACHVDATLVASLSELVQKSEVLPVVRIAALRSLGQWVQLDSPDGPPLRDPALTTSVLQLFLLATHEKEPVSLREQATRGIANVLMCDPLAQQLIAQGVKDALLEMLHELGGKLEPGLAEIEQRLLIAVLVALGNLSEIPVTPSCMPLCSASECPPSLPCLHLRVSPFPSRLPLLSLPLSFAQPSHPIPSSLLYSAPRHHPLPSLPTHIPLPIHVGHSEVPRSAP